MDRGRVWVFVALCMVLIGFGLPMLQIRLLPTVEVMWIPSLFIIALTPWSGFWFLEWVPLILAVIGWAGFTVWRRVAFLRYGFGPIIIVVGVLIVVAIFMALYAYLLLVFNCIPFVIASLVSHQAKRTLQITS
jgi:hypothetical protein